MTATKFLLPFREKKIEKKISSTALLIFVIVVIILFLVANNVISLLSIFLVVFIIFIILRANIIKAIKLIAPATVLIFFLGLPSLFYSQGEILFTIKIGTVGLYFYNSGVWRAIFIWLRGIFSVSVITLYSTCITIQEFIASLRSIFIPNIMVTIILLILRYGPLLYEQGEEIRIAQQMRGIYMASRKIKFQAVGALMGGIILKSIKRGNEVYEAMILRGLEENHLIKREKITALDPIFLFLFTFILSLIAGGLLQCIMR